MHRLRVNATSMRMSVVCISWETAHLHGEAWISHHRLRHRVFVDRLGWQVPSYRGLEYDQFDTPAATYVVWLDGEGLARGAARLIPTTQPYMVKALWPELIDGDLPQTDQIWEATRFVCDRDINSETRRRIVAELICGCQEFGIARGISRYLGVMPVGIFRHVIAAAGCPVTLLGPPKRIGIHNIAAAYIDVSPKTLAVVQQFSAERSTSKMGKTVKPGAEGYIEDRNRPDEDDAIQRPARALSSESLPRTRSGVDTGSREENASEQKVEPRSDLIRTEKALVRASTWAATAPPKVEEKALGRRLRARVTAP
jgi:acyl homoserine lactone synthase